MISMYNESLMVRVIKAQGDPEGRVCQYPVCHK